MYIKAKIIHRISRMELFYLSCGTRKSTVVKSDLLMGRVHQRYRAPRIAAFCDAAVPFTRVVRQTLRHRIPMATYAV